MTADLDPYDNALDLLDRWDFDWCDHDDYDDFEAYPHPLDAESALDRYDNYRYDHK